MFGKLVISSVFLQLQEQFFSPSKIIQTPGITKSLKYEIWKYISICRTLTLL